MNKLPRTIHVDEATAQRIVLDMHTDIDNAETREDTGVVLGAARALWQLGIMTTSGFGAVMADVSARNDQLDAAATAALGADVARIETPVGPEAEPEAPVVSVHAVGNDLAVWVDPDALPHLDLDDDEIRELERLGPTHRFRTLGPVSGGQNDRRVTWTATGICLLQALAAARVHCRTADGTAVAFEKSAGGGVALTAEGAVAALGRPVCSMASVRRVGRQLGARTK